MLKKLAVISLLALLASGCIKQGADDSANVPDHIQQPVGQNFEDVVAQPVESSARDSNTQKPAEAKPATEISYKGEDGKTALELLKSSHSIETKIFSGIGEYVESIEGVKPDSKHFWKLYVNGQSSNVGASSYVTKSSDVIEWRVEEVN